MKECPICNKFPVVKGSGMCYKHHNYFIKKVREYKKEFIETMIMLERPKQEVEP